MLRPPCVFFLQLQAEYMPAFREANMPRSQACFRLLTLPPPPPARRHALEGIWCVARELSVLHVLPRCCEYFQCIMITIARGWQILYEG